MGVVVRQKKKGRGNPFWVFINHNGRRASKRVGDKQSAETVASKISKRWYLVHETMVKRCGKKGAKVVVARRLLTVVFYMLKRKEPYQENYNQPVENRGA